MIGWRLVPAAITVAAILHAYRVTPPTLRVSGNVVRMWSRTYGVMAVPALAAWLIWWVSL